MTRGLRLLLVVAALAVSASGCRADHEDCRELAEHVVELAEAAAAAGLSSAGQGGGIDTAVALEQDCKVQRPSLALVHCMTRAQTLAELDAC